MVIFISANDYIDLDDFNNDDFDELDLDGFWGRWFSLGNSCPDDSAEMIYLGEMIDQDMFEADDFDLID